MRRLLPCLLIVALAGCFTSSEAPAGIPTDANGKSLPTVWGIVVDEAIRPLAGVRISFLGTNVTTTSRADGTYEIFEPTTQYRDVLMTAFKPGFLTRTQQVQVSGRISARLDFGLEINPYAIAHRETIQHRGQVRCDAVVAVAGEIERLGCTTDARGQDGSVPNWIWEINPTPGLAGAVIEVRWNADSAMTEKLHVWVLAPQAGGQGGRTVASVVGTSPLRFEIPEDAARAYPQWTAIAVHVDLADPDTVQGTGVVATNNQLFNAFATLFYVDPAPPGFTMN